MKAQKTAMECSVSGQYAESELVTASANTRHGDVLQRQSTIQKNWNG